MQKSTFQILVYIYFGYNAVQREGNVKRKAKEKASHIVITELVRKKSERDTLKKKERKDKGR